MNPVRLQHIIKDALQEDLGFGDISSAIFPEGHSSSGTFTAKASGILAGLPLIENIYRQLDSPVSVNFNKNDGDLIAAGGIIATAQGPTAALLSAERVILNFIQHLSGIATATRKAVEALDDPQIRICCTRKTLPGLRMLQKYAVRCGGGFNHRHRLDDGIMIKDNHIKAAGSIAKAVAEAKNNRGHMIKIEVETEDREQVREAVEADADIIMFDNRSPEEIRELSALVPAHIITEISGGITLENISDYKGTGADYLSLGFLTHSVTALDIGFNLK